MGAGARECAHPGRDEEEGPHEATAGSSRRGERVKTGHTYLTVRSVGAPSRGLARIAVPHEELGPAAAATRGALPNLEPLADAGTPDFGTRQETGTEADDPASGLGSRHGVDAQRTIALGAHDERSEHHIEWVAWNDRNGDVTPERNGWSRRPRWGRPASSRAAGGGGVPRRRARSPSGRRRPWRRRRGRRRPAFRRAARAPSRSGRATWRRPSGA